MSDWLDYWLSYSLSDFLLFSSRTYYRLIELYNLAIWPAQIGCLLAGAAIVWLLLRPTPLRRRVVAAILAAAWAWIASAFHLERYATINWAAVYFAAAFALQSLLFLWFGVVRDALVVAGENSARRTAGVALVAFAVAVQPFAALMAARPLSRFEVFGAMPDPTVVATLGLAVLLANRLRWLLLAVPLLWCAVGGLTLLAMESPEWPLLPAAGVAALALSLKRRSRGALRI